MNKWQIICPLVAIAMVAAVFGVVSSRNHHRYYVHAQTQMIREELVAATNSPRLLAMGSALRGWLPTFLASQGGVAEVLLGDEPSPRGDGAACSRLILTNAAGARLVIRLRQDAEPERFHVLGYWTITEPNGSANRSQPFDAEANRAPAAAGSGR